MLLPYLFCELRCTLFIFVYIVPFTSKDDKDFADDNEFKAFWAHNPQYGDISQWSLNHFDRDLSTDFTVNFRMSQRNDSLAR